MSRRGVSVRELGLVDCQGWLLRRKEGRSFLGSKWRRYWFVLKKSSLYWYTNKMAEKAEGFINLSGFTIEPAKQCRKKHAVTARHPLIVTIFIAAESFTDMNRWVSKLSEAAETCELVSTEECYSEGSDQEADERASTSCSLNSGQETDDSENGDVLRPLRGSPTGDDGRRSSSEGGGLSGNRGKERGNASEEPPSLLHLPGPGGAGGAASLPHLPGPGGAGRAASLPHLPRPGGAGGAASLPHLQGPGGAGGAGGAASLPLLHVDEATEEEVVHEKPPDEMEFLYNHLKAASLSPIGRSSRRDFRASFVKRCKNDKVNDKLHLLRILSSTLKAKELELLAVDQILTDPGLVAPTYRKWRLSNFVLLQEIAQRHQAAGRR